MLGEVQGGFRRWRMTEDNMLMIERLIELTRGRKDVMFLSFMDADKTKG